MAALDIARSRAKLPLPLLPPAPPLPSIYPRGSECFRRKSGIPSGLSRPDVGAVVLPSLDVLPTNMLARRPPALMGDFMEEEP